MRRFARHGSLLLVVAVISIGTGCGGGEDGGEGLAQGVKAADIGQCLAGQGWDEIERAVSPKPGAGVSHLSTTANAPSDGTPAILTDETLEAERESGPAVFHIVGKYAAVRVEIAGAAITDDERAQVEECAAG